MLEWRGCPGPAPRRAVCLLGLRTAAGGLWGAAWPPTCVRWAGGPPAARTRFLSPTSSPHAAPGTKHTSQGTLPGLGTLRKPPASHTRGATAPSTCPTEASCRAFVPANTGHASHLHSVACPEVPDCATCSLHWKHAARTAEGRPAAGCLPAGRTASPAQAKRTERGPSAAAPSLRWPHGHLGTVCPRPGRGEAASALCRLQGLSLCGTQSGRHAGHGLPRGAPEHA